VAVPPKAVKEVYSLIPTEGRAAKSLMWGPPRAATLRAKQRLPISWEGFICWWGNFIGSKWHCPRWWISPETGCSNR